MAKSWLRSLADNVVDFSKKNDTTILTVSAVTGIILAVAAAYKTAPVAKEIVQNAKTKKEQSEKEINEIDEITQEEKDEQIKIERREITANMVKELVPVVAPSILLAGTSITCVICGHRISSKKIALLTTALDLSKEAFNDFKLKLSEMDGKDKISKVKEAVIKDKMEKEKPDQILIDNGYTPTEGRTVLCVDMPSGQPFWSNPQAVNDAIWKYSNDVYESGKGLNLFHFYNYLGIKETSISREVGFDPSESRERDGHLPIDVYAVMYDGQPALGIDYDPHML